MARVMTDNPKSVLIHLAGLLAAALVFCGLLAHHLSEPLVRLSRMARSVADGRLENSRGVTHKQLAEFMGTIGCTVAFNLDGGGSSTMLFGGKVFNTLSEGSERDISDILYFATGVAGQ